MKAINVIKIMPMERPFSISDISNVLYPDLVKYDTEGRLFNRANPTVARMLRKIKGIQEIKPLIFFAHSEYFNEMD
jgi:hypothetical protein